MDPECDGSGRCQAELCLDRVVGAPTALSHFHPLINPQRRHWLFFSPKPPTLRLFECARRRRPQRRPNSNDTSSDTSLATHVSPFFPNKKKNMPSTPLRRTLSAPAVRLTPYPTSSMRASGAGGRPGRPSAGSLTPSRRVLADLDWWRVMDGQGGEAEFGASALNAGGGSTEEQAADAFWSAPGLFDDVHIEPLSVNWSEAMESPVPELATLSLAPQTPRRLRSRPSASSTPSPTRLFPDGAELTAVLSEAFGAPPAVRAPPTPSKARRSPPSTPTPRRIRGRRAKLARVASEPVLGAFVPAPLSFNEMIGLSLRRQTDTSNQHPDLFL